MIIGEEPLDGGDVILAKGKTLGYLAQRQDLTSGNTIYEEVKSAKADIFAMEAQLRSIEQELKSLTGEDLKNRLDTYNRLQSEYEAKNGYACESEITGVLKGLGSPAPYVKGNYTDHTVATYYGEAMAVVQADGNGPVKVTVADEERFYVVEIPCE